MSLDRAAGLTSSEAAERLKADGYNELPAAQRRGILRILFEVVRQPMFALLIAGGIVYLLLGDRIEAILLLVFAFARVVALRHGRVMPTLKAAGRAGQAL